MHRSENAASSISPHIIVDIIRDAHEFFHQNRIDERYEYMALDLIRRYVSQEGSPREMEPLLGAALLMVSRHPWSHPNPLTKTEFAARLNMKESSIEWYTNSIVDRLGFLVLHDNTRQKFFVDPDGTIASVLESVVRSSVREEVVMGIVRGRPMSPVALAEKIVDRLCSVVKIVPRPFEQDLSLVVQRMIDSESRLLIEELGGPR